MDPIDSPPERLPDPPEWMVEQALAWPCNCPTELNPVNLAHEKIHDADCPDAWATR